MTFKGTLLPFQEEAVDRMVERGSLLLAHEMGLGKTIQAIAAVERLIDIGEAECALVICPASIKWQWKRQIDKFTDGALVAVVEGNKSDRRVKYRLIGQGKVEYLIMNYEQIVSDWEMIRLLEFDVVVGDEIVAIKNPGAKRSRHVKRLDAPYKFGLSGQPIENRPEELFSIMQWIDPEVLGRPDVFERTFIVRNSYGRVQHYKNLKTLRKVMGEAMDRRTRNDVKDQMPAVVEKDYIIAFDATTEKVYRRIVRELIDTIRSTPAWSNFNLMNHYSGVKDNGMGAAVMPMLMALRMLCNHPKLLEYSARMFDDPDTRLGSAYAAEIRSRGVLSGLTRSNKMDEILALVDEILDANPDNKIVIFSFFKPMLALIGEKLKVDFELFTGDLTPKERSEAQERFTKQKRCRVLLSSDAGGIGVDLPAANFLISVDLPWSAGKFAQRNGRIVRISSKWPEVTLINMVMKDSIEERMLIMLEEKLAIASAWIDGTGVGSQGIFSLSAGTLADFLEERY